nr:hypothetical protein [Tanacetum cinerariifolium]
MKMEQYLAHTDYALWEVTLNGNSVVQMTKNEADAQTRFETTSKRSSDPPLSIGHTVRSGEERMKQETNLMDFVPPTPHDLPLSGGHTPVSNEGRPNLLELMNICTKLSNMVLALEEAKTTQYNVITRLKLRVKRLKKKRKGSGEKGGSTVDQVSTARQEVSTATPPTLPITTTIFSNEDLTIAQTLIKMRSKKAKEKGVAFKDVEEPPRLTRSTTTLQPLPTIDKRQREKKWIDDFVPMDSEKEEKKSVEPESKDKKGKRIKRVTDLAPK